MRLQNVESTSGLQIKSMEYTGPGYTTTMYADSIYIGVKNSGLSDTGEDSSYLDYNMCIRYCF